jgi:GST-like protein
VEAALILANVPYDREEVDYTKDTPARDRLLALNPLGQVPTLVLPDGAVMTETAAIVLYLDEQHPAAQLLPREGAARREALRWLIFLIAAVYPTFTYGDEPEKWIGDAGPRLRDATHAHRQKLWTQLEGVSGAPWFLGQTRSMLDVYVSVMTHWRPNRPWFAEHTPKLHAIATAIDQLPELAPLWAREFD